MKNWQGKVLGALTAILLFAAPALAVVAPPTVLYLPPSPDADGTYYLRWRAGSAKPAETLSYVLEQATASDFSDAAAVYTGAGTLYKVVGNTAGTYYYRVKSVGDTSAEESGYTTGAFGVDVAGATTAVADPERVYVPAGSETGTYAVTI